MRKRILVIITIIISMIIIGQAVLAVENNLRLQIIRQASETKRLENVDGYISKKIINSDPVKGEVTIQLQIANSVNEATANKGAEIFLVIDNSGSMDYETSDGKTRKSLIMESSKKLVHSILQEDKTSNIGIIKFEGSGIFDFGSSNDAVVITELTSNETTILNGIGQIENMEVEDGTNIELGLQTAKQNFSTGNHNKIIILLTDGVPTEDAQGNRAMESLVPGSRQKVIDNTKNAVKSLETQGINLITMMTGLENESGNEYEESLDMLTQIFGTSQNPTVGKYYNIQDAQITSVIENQILVDTLAIIKKPINDIEIVDEFPKDIVDNFDFEFVGDPTVGTTEKNEEAIKWKIDTLDNNQTATLEYKLKVKDINNEKLLNKEIATNKNVTINYKDKAKQTHTIILEDSPLIKISQVKEDGNNGQGNKNNQTGTDDTQAKGELPKTGLENGIHFAIIGFIIISAVFYYKVIKSKDVK